MPNSSILFLTLRSVVSYLAEHLLCWGEGEELQYTGATRATPSRLAARLTAFVSAFDNAASPNSSAQRKRVRGFKALVAPKRRSHAQKLHCHWNGSRGLSGAEQPRRSRASTAKDTADVTSRAACEGNLGRRTARCGRDWSEDWKSRLSPCGISQQTTHGVSYANDLRKAPCSFNLEPVSEDINEPAQRSDRLAKPSVRAENGAVDLASAWGTDALGRRQGLAWDRAGRAKGASQASQPHNPA